MSKKRVKESQSVSKNPATPESSGASENPAIPENAEKQRRISPLRVLVAIVLVGVLSVGGMFGWQYWSEANAAATVKPWFAGYVDVTATPSYAFEQHRSKKANDVLLSFIVSAKDDPCAPTWGTHYTMDEAGEQLDLDRRIARHLQSEGNLAVSFGGAINDELALGCTDSTDLLDAYRSVVKRYELGTIDLDLENTGLSNKEAGERRATAVAALQKERRKDGKDLAVWVTLPVAPSGLTKEGTDAVAQLLKSDVDLAGVNGMTMDYGEGRERGQSMIDATLGALNGMHRQLKNLYDASGTHLSEATVWTKIGATPMIGQNDVLEEVFSLADAKKLNEFVLDKGIGRTSMWSANRDRTCGANYVDLTKVSDSCSGIDQGEEYFAEILGNKMTGTLASEASRVTVAEESKAPPTDDPKKSPYPIWNEAHSYVKDAKVVWHQNVYQAKWWTRGELPDNPALNAWETPWEFVGPVLPGETPLPVPTVPKGLLPEWSGKNTYEKGAHVIFEETVYESKWWNQGESPEASASDPDSSPWVPLSQSEIDKLVAKLGGSPENPVGGVEPTGTETP